MKRLLIFLLLALSVSANAQVNKKAQFLYFLSQQSGGSAPYVFNYTDIPARPTLGTNAIITYSAPGNILNSTGGTTQDKILLGYQGQKIVYKALDKGTAVVDRKLDEKVK